jgi:hypothetical protein
MTAPTQPEFLSAIDTVIGLVTVVFDFLDGWKLYTTPDFTLLDLFVGAAFITITLDFHRRLTEVKV